MNGERLRTILPCLLQFVRVCQTLIPQRVHARDLDICRCESLEVLVQKGRDIRVSRIGRVVVAPEEFHRTFLEEGGVFELFHAVELQLGWVAVDVAGSWDS